MTFPVLETFVTQLLNFETEEGFCPFTTLCFCVQPFVTVEINCNNADATRYNYAAKIISRTCCIIELII